jgi:hypothetical protein
MVYMTDEEIKHNKFMILRNSICRGPKDINKIIEEEYSKIKKEKDYIKKEQKIKSKVPSGKYNY